MRKLIRSFLNKFGYDIIKLPPRISDSERENLNDLFSRIYHENMWGGSRGEFNSGPGSDIEVGQEYARVIREYIKTNGIKSMVDIGCGDFRIGRQIISEDLDYTGIDVVPSLIEENQRKYGSSKVRFIHLDATKDQLPAADLCTIRQVLQHLSNKHISAILDNCRHFPHLIVSEHVLLTPGIIANVDMPADWTTRVDRNSCVRLDLPPYNYRTELLLEVDPKFVHHPDSRIRTEKVYR